MADLLSDLQDMAALPLATTDEEVFAAKKSRNAFFERIKADPAQLTEEMLDVLTVIAAKSPFSDVDNPDPEFIHHDLPPAQEISLETVRLLMPLARVAPTMGAQIIDRMESLARDNLDYDVRHQAVMSLWMLAIGKDDGLKGFAAAALERQGVENSNSFIRVLARDQLLNASDKNPDLLPRATEAMIHGAGDSDPAARTRALALLTTHVKSSACTYEEGVRLMQVFETAAAQACGQDRGAQYWAEQGVTEAQEARRNDVAKQVVTTGESVKPLKTVEFKKNL